jgi:hypothetical protein
MPGRSTLAARAPARLWLVTALKMKGDRVEIVVAADDGSRTYDITATRAGRRVEITTGRGIIEVVEVTRSGEACAPGQIHGQPRPRAGRASLERSPNNAAARRRDFPGVGQLRADARTGGAGE